MATLLISRLLPIPFGGSLKQFIHRETNKADAALIKARTGTTESRAAFLSSDLFSKVRPVLLRPSSRTLVCKDDDSSHSDHLDRTHPSIVAIHEADVTEERAAAIKEPPTDTACLVIATLINRRDIDHSDKAAIVQALADDPTSLSIQISIVDEVSQVCSKRIKLASDTNTPSPGNDPAVDHLPPGTVVRVLADTRP